MGIRLTSRSDALTGYGAFIARRNTMQLQNYENEFEER